jgi:carbamate kinase
VSAIKGIHEVDIKSPLLADLLQSGMEPSASDVANQLKAIGLHYSASSMSLAPTQRADEQFTSKLKELYRKLVPSLPTETITTIANILQVTLYSQ